MLPILVKMKTSKQTIMCEPRIVARVIADIEWEHKHTDHGASIRSW